MPNLVPHSMNEWMRRMELRVQDVSDRVSNLVARDIADTVDLDDYLFSGRFYRASTTGTTTALGYPEDGAAGTLEVSRNPGIAQAQQIFHNRVSGISWIRWWDGATWGPWMSGGSESGNLWQDYTPTFTNLSVGNGTLTARYTENGKTVHFWVDLEFGSTTSVTGVIEVSVPITGISTTGFVYPMGTGLAKAAGATGSNVWKGFTTNGGSGPLTVSRILTANGANAGAWNVNEPFTWSDGANLSVMAMYEAA